MALQLGIGTTEKIKSKTVDTIPVLEVKVSKGIDKNRFSYVTNQTPAPLIVASWGYCYCNNCNIERVFKRTIDKVVCGNCSYIICYL